jgi:hypothetical protein
MAPSNDYFGPRSAWSECRSVPSVAGFIKEPGFALTGMADLWSTYGPR